MNIREKFNRHTIVAAIQFCLSIFFILALIIAAIIILANTIAAGLFIFFASKHLYEMESVICLVFNLI